MSNHYHLDEKKSLGNTLRKPKITVQINAKLRGALHFFPHKMCA